MDKLQRVACGLISLKFSAPENLQTGAGEQEGIFKLNKLYLNSNVEILYGYSIV